MKILFTFVSILVAIAANAQTAGDPVVMTVNGIPVSRSEFVYSYSKNNGDGVIDKKTVEEYADLYVNYKLKVAAALDARLNVIQKRICSLQKQTVDAADCYRQRDARRGKENI